MKRIAFVVLLLIANTAFAGKFTKEIDRRVDEKISTFLDQGQQVNLLILNGKVTNAFPVSNDWYEGWKTSALNSTSSRMLRKFSENKNFRLVDRASIDSILREIKFQSTGAISPDSSKEIGKLSGATHFLVIEMNRFQEKAGFIDLISQKLIDVETGDVIAISNDSLDEKGRVLKKKY